MEHRKCTSEDEFSNVTYILYVIAFTMAKNNIPEMLKPSSFRIEILYCNVTFEKASPK